MLPKNILFWRNLTFLAVGLAIITACVGAYALFMYEVKAFKPGPQSSASSPPQKVALAPGASTTNKPSASKTPPASSQAPKPQPAPMPTQPGASRTTPTPAPSTSPASAPVALVYRGPAGCDGCSEAVAALLQQSPYGFNVKYIGPNETLKLVPSSFAGATLYAQPGGDGSASQAEQALGSTGESAIKNFVNGGGRYLGFCMGAYLAGSNPGMGLLAPGDTDEYILTSGASTKSTSDTVIALTWGSATRYAFVQDPAYIIPSGMAGEKILSRFSNGLVNSLVKPYGKGWVGVVGSHPEADRSWYTSALWSADKDGLDAANGLELVATLMSS